VLPWRATHLSADRLSTPSLRGTSASNPAIQPARRTSLRRNSGDHGQPTTSGGGEDDADDHQDHQRQPLAFASSGERHALVLLVRSGSRVRSREPLPPLWHCQRSATGILLSFDSPVEGARLTAWRRNDEAGPPSDSDLERAAGTRLYEAEQQLCSGVIQVRSPARRRSRGRWEQGVDDLADRVVGQCSVGGRYQFGGGEVLDPVPVLDRRDPACDQRVVRRTVASPDRPSMCLRSADLPRPGSALSTRLEARPNEPRRAVPREWRLVPAAVQHRATVGRT
jgi:hypothetical protein